MGAVTSRLAPHIISQAMDDVNRQVLQYLSTEVLQYLQIFGGYSEVFPFVSIEVPQYINCCWSSVMIHHCCNQFSRDCRLSANLQLKSHRTSFPTIKVSWLSSTVTRPGATDKGMVGEGRKKKEAASEKKKCILCNYSLIKHWLTFSE